MKRSLEEPLTVQTLMRDCGPLVIFAENYKLTIPALRALSQSERMRLEPIVFALSHIGIAIPPDCINSCLAVYKDIATCCNDFNAYIADHIDPLLTMLSFNYRLVLLHAIRKMFQATLANVETIPATPEEAIGGDRCRERGCICMLIGKSIYDIETIQFQELAPLWLTKCCLTSSFVPKKQRHEQTLFSDTEDEECLEQEPLWQHNSVPLQQQQKEHVQDNDDDFSQRDTVAPSY